MANAHKHKQRVIRGADDQLWEDLDTATSAAGTDRSAVTREFWAWYVGRPGAELPQRPARVALDNTEARFTPTQPLTPHYPDEETSA